jgi:ABC-type spermidine/putrescine transport system permease subunit I
MNAIVAMAVQPIMKVLAKAAAKAALKLHKGVFHDTAERYRKEIEEAKQAAKVLVVAIAVSVLCGCMAYKRAFVLIHDSIDETLEEQTAR